MAIQGMDSLRRGMEVTMHAVVNDLARDLAANVNKVEPKFQAKPEQTGSAPQAAQVTVTGKAELSKDSRDKIITSIENAIENTMGR